MLPLRTFKPTMSLMHHDRLMQLMPKRVESNFYLTHFKPKMNCYLYAMPFEN